MATLRAAGISTADLLFPDPPRGTCAGSTDQRAVTEALGWVGTPYRHQGARRGVGCDCLGLVRGVWCSLYGFELPESGPYAPDWAESSGADRLLAELSFHFHEIPEPAAGCVLLFRWRANLPAKHLGVLVDSDCFVHAYEGAGAVVRSRLVPQWRRRIACAFAFPNISIDRSI
jgi:NlpC/P60 family putative phage cell wall peptidase